jgi:hypothetical protein
LRAGFEHLAQVHACTKRRTRAGQDHGPHAPFEVQIAQGLIQLFEQRPAQGVALLRAVEDDRPGVLMNVDFNDRRRHRDHRSSRRAVTVPRGV